ncbi:MAG: sterol desaturase family protein [Candidatus Riflebacteria bacterium]|nr:sterol desaturase family protein [Candidatus Riflebacteria bacterium]
MWEAWPSEPYIRLGSFGAVLAAMALWEALALRRPPTVNRRLRWVNNLGLVVLNSALVRMVAPLGAVGFAVGAETHGAGALRTLSLPYWASVVAAVVLFDLAIYLQHVMLHAVPAFWRLHMVHHADLDFDVTTGLRFHTLEIVLSLGIKAAVVLALGPPPASVLIFEVLLNATSMFNHGNVRMPPRLDRFLRWFLVTPDMHRVHHSTIAGETNSNFGFNLPWWDFLLGTYRDQPAAGHEAMVIGLTHFRDELQVDRLHRMLTLPFVGAPGDYPIDRRGRGT